MPTGIYYSSARDLFLCFFFEMYNKSQLEDFYRFPCFRKFVFFRSNFVRNSGKISKLPGIPQKILLDFFRIPSRMISRTVSGFFRSFSKNFSIDADHNCLQSCLRKKKMSEFSEGVFFGFSVRSFYAGNMNHTNPARKFE